MYPEYPYGYDGVNDLDPSTEQLIGVNIVFPARRFWYQTLWSIRALPETPDRG